LWTNEPAPPRLPRNQRKLSFRPAGWRRGGGLALLPQKRGCALLPLLHRRGSSFCIHFIVVEYTVIYKDEDAIVRGELAETLLSNLPKDEGKSFDYLAGVHYDLAVVATAVAGEELYEALKGAERAPGVWHYVPAAGYAVGIACKGEVCVLSVRELGNRLEVTLTEDFGASTLYPGVWHVRGRAIAVDETHAAFQLIELLQELRQYLAEAPMGALREYYGALAGKNIEDQLRTVDYYLRLLGDALAKRGYILRSDFAKLLEGLLGPAGRELGIRWEGEHVYVGGAKYAAERGSDYLAILKAVRQLAEQRGIDSSVIGAIDKWIERLEGLIAGKQAAEARSGAVAPAGAEPGKQAQGIERQRYRTSLHI